ncbi:DUF1707 domain-containing protein [Umezawaea tangerina]|uniref:DUF1707 domain-containing protein n=1 Tax=Umezawaea tangerina TaxID=84725 RepID=UPI0011B29060|nr:DUF1707 domain-containing protein [Umezawaea tangerina]
MRASVVAWWNAQARKGARRLHAVAVLDYGLACGGLDQDRYARLRQVVLTADYHDLPAVVADVPAPRWDTMPVGAPVDDHQRAFAATLLDIAARYGLVDGSDRRWRTAFAAKARTAADLLVLFLDLEPHLRHRRDDPAMVAGLDRLAFVRTILKARGRGRLSRAEFDGLLERTAAGDDLDVLRAEVDNPGQADRSGSADLSSNHVTWEGAKAEPTEVDPAGVEPVATLEPRVKTRRVPRAKPVVKPEPVAEPEPRVETRRVPGAKPEPVVEPEPVAEVEPVAEPVIRPVPPVEIKLVPKARAVAKPEPVAKPKTVAKVDPEIEACPVVRAKPVAEVGPVAKSDPVAESKPAAEPERAVDIEPAVAPVAAEPPALDLDRARIAKYLEQALFDERLGPGEYSARTVAVWSATTSHDLAELVVDLPLPADEPLRDRRPDAHADDLLTPAQRQTALDRLDRAMAGGALTLWEYETRLDAAVNARTFQDLAPVTDHLPPGW